MEYIVHKRFKQKGASGKEYNFPYGTKLNSIGEFIKYNGELVCATTSENAHKYFSRNNDGKGLERGRLTYAIAYSSRHPNKTDGFRFTPEERDMLATDYNHFLVDNGEWILFNHHFFNAKVDELSELAKKLGVY